MYKFEIDPIIDIDENDELNDIHNEMLGEAKPELLTDWLAKNHPEANVRDVKLYLAAATLDNQSDEGGEGWVFDNYVRDVGMFGYRDVDDLFASDDYPFAGHSFDWPHLFHRVCYGLPTVQAYAIQTIAADYDLTVDELQLYLAARSFYLADKFERERNKD